jgi:hypothetical protein
LCLEAHLARGQSEITDGVTVEPSDVAPRLSPQDPEAQQEAKPVPRHGAMEPPTDADLYPRPALN